MNLSIHRLPRVERDLSEYYAFIAQDKLEPADRFLEVAKASFARLAENPEVGLPFKSSRRHLHGIYSYPMPSPYRAYIIFYRVTGATLEVITVQQGSQNLDALLADIVE
jgi:plasmid stabilization system protein ParE